MSDSPEPVLDRSSAVPPVASARARGYAAMRRTFVKKSGKGIATEALADRVLEALTSKSPRTRYPMGRDTVGYRILQKLPDKMVDGMLGPSLEHTRKHVEAPG